MTLLVDNYDSFTNNLSDYLAQLGQEVLLIKNDEFSLEEIQSMNFDNILIAPGPHSPHEAGICLDLIRKYYLKLPILGICLGHQAIGVFFGAELKKALKPIHGYVSKINLSVHPIFAGLPAQVDVMRYHSLILANLPEEIQSLSVTTQNEIMIIKHTTLPILGLQFHPESILTPSGIIFLKNWFQYIEARVD